MPRTVIFLILCSILLSTHAHAEIYKWRDDKGALHFTDKPPAESSDTGVETLADTPGSGSTFTQAVSRSSAHPESDPRPAYRDAKVEVYLTSWCPWCKKTLDFFRERGVRVRAYDIEKDPSAARRKNQLAPRTGVPTTVVNGQVIRGHAPRAFEAALRQSP